MSKVCENCLKLTEYFAWEINEAMNKNHEIFHAARGYARRIEEAHCILNEEKNKRVVAELEAREFMGKFKEYYHRYTEEKKKKQEIQIVERVKTIIKKDWGHSINERKVSPSILEQCFYNSFCLEENNL